MFTGIVEEMGSVAAATGGSLVIAAGEVLKGMKPGGSVAVNGVCLTATTFDSKSFSADVMPETLRQTNLGQLRTGDRVNLERPLALGGQVGGHLVQGHVDETGRVVSVTGEGEALLVRFEASPGVMRFIVPKGFVAVDGVSLTVTERDTDSFRVSLVGYSRQHTILGGKKAGDLVNLEADIIAKYVAQLSQPQSTGITADFLQEHGFPVN
ncbi:riboflavin synthase [Chloroflexota bacterium]